MALPLVETAHRLGHRGVRRPTRIRRLSCVAEPADRHVHDSRVHRDDVVVAEAEFPERARLEVLAHDVESRCETEREIAPGRRAQVDAYAALAEVVAQERGPDP